MQMNETIVLDPKVTPCKESVNTSVNILLPQEVLDTFAKISKNLQPIIELAEMLGLLAERLMERVNDSLESLFKFLSEIITMLEPIEDCCASLYEVLETLQQAQMVYNPSIYTDPGPLPSLDDFEIYEKPENNNPDFVEYQTIFHFHYLLSFYGYLVQIKDFCEVIFFYLPLLGMNLINEQPSQVINVDVHIHIDSPKSLQDNDIDMIDEFINESLLQEL